MKKTILLIALAIIVLGGCDYISKKTSEISVSSSEEPVSVGEYPPLIYVNDKRYQSLGKSVTELPGSADYLGTITNKVQFGQFSPTENFSSNFLEVDTELYYDSSDDVIYAEVTVNDKLKYVIYISKN